MKASYDGSCASTLPTIMKCGRINRWKRMRRWLEKSSRQQRARSFLCRRLADCIIAICGQRKRNWLKCRPTCCTSKQQENASMGCRFETRQTKHNRAQQGTAGLTRTKLPPHARLNFREGQGRLQAIVRLRHCDYCSPCLFFFHFEYASSNRFISVGS